MRLAKLTISNYRSIKDLPAIRIEALQAFVGGNDTGKSNVLRAIDAFLGASSAGVDKADFHDPSKPILIEAEFTGLSESERRRLRSYLIGDRLILQKSFTLGEDARSHKIKVSTEYHGYKAEPKDWWLSANKIVEKLGARPNWSDIAQQHELTEYVQGENGKVTKASYEAGLERYLLETDVEYDEPELGTTQALGLQPNLLSPLPEFYLLSAITDYSDEIDSRSTTTVFRRLMSDLSDRFISKDPQYVEVENALKRVRDLFNVQATADNTGRLPSLSEIETKILDNIRKLMPSVLSVHLGVEVEEPRNVFAKGVNIKINDGALTGVLEKGNGMQRCLVFSLLQLLIAAAKEKKEDRPIILGIEEPELYIHPHSQRLIFKVLKDFAGIQADNDLATGMDQVIYSTHSPAFIDVARYEQIACVRKDGSAGTKAKQCELGVLGDPEERKGFKLLTSFGLKHNEVFFARHAVLVEGVEDEIAVVAAGRKLQRFVDLPDEIGVSIVVTGNKEQIPKFQKVLNAFGLSYSVLLELDGEREDVGVNYSILELAGANSVGKIPETLESTVNLGKDHFRDIFEAKQFFSAPAHVSADLEMIVTALLPQQGGQPAAEAGAEPARVPAVAAQ